MRKSPPVAGSADGGAGPGGRAPAAEPMRVPAALARATFPAQRLVVAFQPHLYSRTRDFAHGFASALAAADACFLLALYPSREHPIPGALGFLAHAGGRVREHPLEFCAVGE